MIKLRPIRKFRVYWKSFDKMAKSRIYDRARAVALADMVVKEDGSSTAVVLDDDTNDLVYVNHPRAKACH